MAAATKNYLNAATSIIKQAGQPMLADRLAKTVGLGPVPKFSSVESIVHAWLNQAMGRVS